MHVALIVAMTPEHVIGRDGVLPWRLPDDLKHFRRTTLGHPVIMGRKTFEALARQPLDGRTNIVLTRESGFEAAGCMVAASGDEALQLARSALGTATEVMVIGGAEVFRLFLPQARRMYVTWVQASVAGDTFFPAVNWAMWEQLERADHAADARHRYAFTIATYALQMQPT